MVNNVDRELFDKKWYEQHYLESTKYSGSSYQHYIQVGWKKGYVPSPYFSTKKYLENNPDVKESGICPLLHYMKDGKRENRKIYYSYEYFGDIFREDGLFDEMYYRAQLKDGECAGSSFTHYATIGYKKGYDPSPEFSTSKYLKINFDLGDNICPLLHYYLYGKNEGRKKYKVDTQLEGLYLKRNEMKEDRIKNLIKYQNIIHHNRQNRFLVVLHFYFYSSWEEIQSYLENLSPYKFDLYVAYVEGKEWSKYHEQIRAFKHDTVFLKVENVGFDLASYINVLNIVDLKKYKAVFKLQTKGTYDRSEIVQGKFYKDRDWFVNLFDAILGPENVHKTISMLTDNSDNIGMVAAENLIVSDLPFLQSLVAAKLKKINVQVPEHYSFVAGTCFCVRAEIADEFKKLHYDNNIFSESVRGTFSMAHAFERYVGFFVEMQGYKISGIAVDEERRRKWTKLEASIKKYDGVRLSEDKSLKLSAECILRNLQNRIILDYHIGSIEMDKIKVFIDNKVNTIIELAPYKYLTNKTKYYSEYINYCRGKIKTDFFEFTEDEYKCLDDSVFIERFQNLYNNMDINNYGCSKDLIVIDEETHFILDGLQRASVLYYKYGKNYRAKVLLVKYGYYDLSSAIPYTNKLRNIKTRKYEELD